jgi:hypothetical protein
MPSAIVLDPVFKIDHPDSQPSCEEGNVDVFSIQPDGTEDLVASGLRAAEVEALRDWFRYTKPIGRSVKIVARPISACDSAYSVLAAGTEPDLTERVRADQWRSFPSRR